MDEIAELELCKTESSERGATGKPSHPSDVLLFQNSLFTVSKIVL